MTEKSEDTRTTGELLTQWRKLEEIRRCLIRQGLVSGDANAAEIVAALRVAIPPDVFTDK